MDEINDLLNRSDDSGHGLKDSDEHFRLLVDSVSDYAIYMLDPTGRIVSWNTGAQHIKGYSKNEVVGQNFSLFFTAEDIERGKPAALLEIALREGKYQEEGWRVRKGGTLFWASALITALFDTHGNLQGFGKVTRDMTNARRAQEALRQSEERFRLLVEGVRDYAIFMLDATGHVASWNGGARLINGYTPEEIIGHHFSIFYPPEDIHDRKPERELQIATADGRYEEEGWRLRKGGSRFWANVLITALFDDHGHLYGFAKVTRDLTERKLSEEQREQLREREQQLRHEREARAQMEAADQMRDSFLTILAHELRTPLTSLIGNAEMLLRRGQREGDLSDRGQRNVKVIINQAARLNDMVSLQLDISRLYTGQLRIERVPLDVGAVAQQIVEEFLPTVTVHTLEYAGPTTPLLVAGDKLRLIQVLQNLVQNAIKYSPAGGAIQIKVEQRDATVRVAVSDTGMGIPEAEVANLFRRFYRASNVNERQISGLGIGLYVVKELVTLHAGTVDVVSEEGRGSTFIITLPLFEDQTPSQASSELTTGSVASENTQPQLQNNTPL
jgi:PAS domain S-box-containing protein